jgi:hypothetical protein
MKERAKKTRHPVQTRKEETVKTKKAADAWRREIEESIADSQNLY